MSSVSASIIINHPIQAIFDYIISPQNGPKYIPYLKENSNINPIEPSVGQTFNWRYAMSGFEMKGEAKVIELVSPKKYAIATNGNIASMWTFLLNEEGAGVKITMTIDYEFDQNLLKMLIDQLILDKFNQKAVEDVLENLKGLLET